MVQHAHITFDNSVPVLNANLQPYKMGDSEKQIVDAEITKYLAKGIIREIEPEQVKFMSNVFVRPKKDGGHRVILNLSTLNKSIEYHKFKMETLNSIIELMRPGCYMASLDLKDAYYTLPVALEHQGYLAFPWVDENQNYRVFAFTCLPNGLTSAPRMFTKLLKPALAHLRSLGVTIAIYIDDTYLQANSVEECLNSIQSTQSLLGTLGFTINVSKSIFVPTQSLVMLGFVLDSVEMTVRPTPQKVQSVVTSCLQFSKKETTSLRSLAKLIGSLVGLFPGVEFGKLHYRNLERLKIEGLKANRGNFDSKVHLTHESRKDLEWWIKHLPSSKRLITHGPTMLTFRTDASSQGWGAVLNGSCTGGRWTPEEAAFHINTLELLAVLFGLKSLCAELSDLHIRVEVDNSTAVSYINAMGGTVSQNCDQVALSIWNWAWEHNIWFTAAHIAGTSNTEADRASRVFQDRTEWMLKKPVFEDICGFLGQPTIDLFASRLNAQLTVFVSWQPDPQASFVDAFSLDWSSFALNYIFPPFSLITRCLQKLELEKAEAIIIVPLWPTQCWFPCLLNSLIALPILLPKLCMQLPTSNSAAPPKARLIAARVSGKTSAKEEFLRELPMSSSTAGNQALGSNTREALTNGQPFVIRGRNITLRRLFRRSLTSC